METGGRRDTLTNDQQAPLLTKAGASGGGVAGYTRGVAGYTVAVDLVFSFMQENMIEQGQRLD